MNCDARLAATTARNVSANAGICRRNFSRLVEDRGDLRGDHQADDHGGDGDGERDKLLFHVCMFLCVCQKKRDATGKMPMRPSTDGPIMRRGRAQNQADGGDSGGVAGGVAGGFDGGASFFLGLIARPTAVISNPVTTMRGAMLFSSE